jgi:hypothetical protein
LDGAEHSVRLSHVMADVMADRLAPREPIPNLSTWRSANHVTMSKFCGQERAAEVVEEESANREQNARHMRALPLW